MAQKVSAVVFKHTERHRQSATLLSVGMGRPTDSVYFLPTLNYIRVKELEGRGRGRAVPTPHR